MLRDSLPQSKQTTYSLKGQRSTWLPSLMITEKKAVLYNRCACGLPVSMNYSPVPPRLPYAYIYINATYSLLCPIMPTQSPLPT